jgi:signal transduction histidine kinase
MWTANETARALRGEKATILREWLTEAQTRLWHLDKSVLTRKGAAVRCAAETLSALAERASAAEASLLERAAERERLAQQGAEWWDALPIAWEDMRVLLQSLAVHTGHALARRDADAATLEREDGIFSALIAAVADRRIAAMQREQAALREEGVVSQHLTARFLGNASHELRTPLTAVLGFAELLLEESYGPLNEEQRTAVGHIENSAQNLLEIINNLLDLLHVRAGQLTLHHRPFVIAPMLQNLYDILSPLARRKNVRFVMELPEDLGAMEADENIIRHILYHLLASALRATVAGGQVILSARRDAQTVTFTTHDTALHLPPEAIANTAEPFPILENAPTRGYEGWEVGLPLVRRYVALHDGTLAIESQPEQGTTFRITLPASRAARVECPP